jgi:CDP-glucose 4,6-dehydratase
MEGLELNKGMVDPLFWKDKKVFVTGHTGFKGSWLSLILQRMGAIVKGYSLEVDTEPAIFQLANVSKGMESEFGDIRNLMQLDKSMIDFAPEILIHMAAQPLVRLSYKNPVDTYATNVIGTVNVLEVARKCSSLKSIVCITTDKCYENKEWEWGYRENEPMGGHDPYSSSKGCAELVVSAYRRSFFNSESNASVASARAGNVIGGGDWAEDRLIPDIIRAFQSSKPVLIRNPLSTRPWQHVLEPLSGYLVLAQKLYSDGDAFAEGWNFGPKDEDSKPVSWVLDRMVGHWGYGASWKLDRNNNPHEANLLKLDCSKAAYRLNWVPKWNIETALEATVDWYKVYLESKDGIREFTEAQISCYLDS